VASVTIRWLIAVGCSLLFGSGSVAFADGRTATLAYEDLSGETDCPDDARLRTAVAERLGYDPFRAEAELALTVSIERTGPRLVARVEARAGEAHGVRVLAARRGRCAELGASVALALAIAIVPFGHEPVPEHEDAAAEIVLTIEREPEPPLAPVPPVPPERASPAPTPEPPPIGVSAWLGGAIAIAQLPDIGFGVRTGVELAWPVFAIAIGGRAFFPTSSELGTGSVDGALYAGEIALCARFGEIVGACGLAVLGGFVGSASDLPENRMAVGLAFALGARATGTLRLGESPFFLRIELDLLVPIVRSVLEVGSEWVWTAPPIGLDAGFFVGAGFS
jgi:hypothetical protein